MLQRVRNTVGPLFLMTICPPFVMLMWYTNTALDGSLYRLLDLIKQQGFLYTLYTIWHPVFFGSATAWLMIISFAIFELSLMKLLPGKKFLGPITPKGNIPVYRANGLFAYTVTVVTFCFATFVLKLFPATIIYDNLGAIFGALNIASLLVCLLLYFKGRLLPSSTDSGLTGNIIFDYYWGTELYPVVRGWNIKQFINCRFGMMSWGLFLLSYAAKQQELSGLSNAMFISVALQLIYITKFFIWETGYLRSLDIMHDRAGFYICWGCLVWVPCIYTSPSMYLVLHPVQLNIIAAYFIFNLGVLGIFVNFMADKQRQLVRATNGECKIWWKSPVMLRATYTTSGGDEKENILLASGFWGVSRHFHYLPEILAAFCWTVPALFLNITPYFYVIFLTVLLIDRAYRDDARCARKYGDGWNAYCKIVPFKIIPYVI